MASKKALSGADLVTFIGWRVLFSRGIIRTLKRGASRNKC